ncbi:MAG: PIN domain-containing protein [Candidatus Atribacteria bacterium]|nr:MAG: PIN domain-containing protein [Candidatus Atribacteria bacterium]
MKNTIFLDTGVISLYLSNQEVILKEIKTKRKNKYRFISSELNYIELFNHLCREKGKINAQIIMENLRKGDIIDFVPVSENISILAGELKCKYKFLSMVDAIIFAEALTRKIFIYTTETHFKDIDNLKVKKINY